MKLKSFFKKLFGGEIIDRVQSPINGEILVVKELSGKTVMRAGGITQSGGMVENIWSKILSNIEYQISDIQSVLILGLGAGTVAKLLAEKWPGIKITGIEIDQTIIKIGKKYFGLSKIPNLKIVITDAVETINNQQSAINNRKYNLILIDLYKGQEFPAEAEKKEFLNGLKKISAKNGLIIFNRLNFGIHKERTAKFVKLLEKQFSKVSLLKTEFNLFLLVS